MNVKHRSNGSTSGYRIVAVHTIHDEQQSQVSFEDYSRFKYGSLSIAQRYGRELASAVWSSELRTVLEERSLAGQKTVVYPPPFINLPTAGYFLTHAFFTSLNRLLFSCGGSPLLFGKVWRKKSYYTDYSRLSKAEREGVFADEVFTADVGLLEPAYALFVDDIRITGAHEDRILKMLDHVQKSQDEVAMLHYARVEIPGLDAAIEDRMNRAAMSDLSNVVSMIHTNDFAWNTRVVKHVLSMPAATFDPFSAEIGAAARNDLLNSALSNGYGLLPEFAANVSTLMSSNS